KAFALLNSLDAAQRAKAILSYRVADLVLGPGQDGKTIQPEGLKATALNAKQRAMLLDLIAEWSGIVHESAAAARMAEIRSGLDEYVQASKISLARDLVRVELRLTPGVKVLPRVLAAIDTNGDGVLSTDEQRAYADHVRRDLSLAVDGAPLALRIVALEFPSVA